MLYRIGDAETERHHLQEGRRWNRHPLRAVPRAHMEDRLICTYGKQARGEVRPVDRTTRSYFRVPELPPCRLERKQFDAHADCRYATRDIDDVNGYPRHTSARDLPRQTREAFGKHHQ